MWRRLAPRTKIFGCAILLLAFSALPAAHSQNPLPSEHEPPSPGLAVGRHAPPFSASDQFGRTQTLDTLRGPNGTVLLFFRSADW
jgi:hypothetical protein